jgi:hypothetical protein
MHDLLSGCHPMRQPMPQLMPMVPHACIRSVWCMRMNSKSCYPAMLPAGIKYDPEKLAAVLSARWPKVYGRALKITTLFSAFIASIGQVQSARLYAQPR